MLSPVHVASLLVGAGAVLLPGRHAGMAMHDKTIVAMPMMMFRSECLGMQSAVRNPGAGMTPDSIEPFKLVLKDGYFNVECVDDYMFAHGDKYGDNKFSYKIGETSNVSIVHYSMHVAKEDQESMTPDVCFSFCRTIPDMTFFGIRNGKDCYCTPYFRSVEGDDSMCNVVCEGDGSRICGSKTKSSIFGMHMCSNTQTKLNDLSVKQQDMGRELNLKKGEVDVAATSMQSTAERFQDIFGQAGDPVAADLMQTAKVHAGELAELVADANRLKDKVTAADAQANSMSGGDFSTPAQLKAAEEVMDRMTGLTADSIAATADLTSHLDSAQPSAPANDSALEQYYEALYFVDKSKMDKPSTCGGTAAHTPLLGSMATCAHACNVDVHECVGFSYFQGLCFLMSKFKTMTHYDKCGTGGSTLVDPKEVRCMAKLSKFEGTTLAPDGAGKCKECFKEVTQADRCFGQLR